MTGDRENDRDNRGGVHAGVSQKAYYYNYLYRGTFVQLVASYHGAFANYLSQKRVDLEFARGGDGHCCN